MPKSQPVSIAEAARVLNVSRRTVQRMVTSGTLRGEKHGGKWAITLPIDTQQVGADVTGVQRALSDQLARESAELAQRVTSLTERLAVAEAKIVDLTADRDYLRQALAMALANQQRALPAPGKRRAWWRFWERDEGGAGEG